MSNVTPTSKEKVCDCHDGYRYFPHSSGEPSVSACIRCRPDEAKEEARMVSFFLLVIGVLVTVVVVGLVVFSNA
jgi:hypothetical protein